MYFFLQMARWSFEGRNTFLYAVTRNVFLPSNVPLAIRMKKYIFGCSYSKCISSFTQNVFLPSLKMYFFLHSKCISSFTQNVFLPSLKMYFFLHSKCISSFTQNVFLPSLKMYFFLHSKCISSFKWPAGHFPTLH